MCFDEKEATNSTSAARASNTDSMIKLVVAPASSQGELVMSLPGIKMVIDSSKVCFTNPFLRFPFFVYLGLFSLILH